MLSLVQWLKSPSLASIIWGTNPCNHYHLRAWFCALFGTNWALNLPCHQWLKFAHLSFSFSIFKVTCTFFCLLICRCFCWWQWSSYLFSSSIFWDRLSDYRRGQSWHLSLSSSIVSTKCFMRLYNSYYPNFAGSELLTLRLTFAWLVGSTNTRLSCFAVQCRARSDCTWQYGRRCAPPTL